MTKAMLDVANDRPIHRHILSAGHGRDDMVIGEPPDGHLVIPIAPGGSRTRVSRLNRIHRLEILSLNINGDMKVGWPKLVDARSDRVLLMKRPKWPARSPACCATGRTRLPIRPIRRQVIARCWGMLHGRDRKWPDIESQPISVGYRRVGDPRVDVLSLIPRPRSH